MCMRIHLEISLRVTAIHAGLECGILRDKIGPIDVVYRLVQLLWGLILLMKEFILTQLMTFGHYLKKHLKLYKEKIMSYAFL
jgi:hypothetical protein